MTLCADSLLRSVVTGKAGRIVTLSSGSVDLENVRGNFCRRFGQPVTAAAFGPGSVSLVFEVVQSRRRTRAWGVLQGHHSICVTDSALAELFARLMGVAAITLGMLREVRLHPGC